MASRTQSVAREQLTGFRELRTALRRLPAEMEDKVLTSAVEAGGKIVERAARANVPRETGALANAIRLVVTKGQRGTKAAKSRIGIDKKYRQRGRRPVRYAHLVEFGHHSKDGRFLPPKAFLRRAISGNANRIKTAMTATIKQGLKQATKTVAQK